MIPENFFWWCFLSDGSIQPTEEKFLIAGLMSWTWSGKTAPGLELAWDKGESQGQREMEKQRRC